MKEKFKRPISLRGIHKRRCFFASEKYLLAGGVLRV